MQDMTVNNPTTIPFMALHRVTGEPMEGARISIRREADKKWWNGSEWQADIAYNNMTFTTQGAHEFEMTFSEAGDYQLIYTDATGNMVNFSEMVTVYPDRRLEDDDLFAAIRGSGATYGTLTITTEDGTPVPDAGVWVTIDEQGTDYVTATLQTNSVGVVELWLDSGVTYYVWAQKDGKVFNNPYTVVW